MMGIGFGPGSCGELVQGVNSGGLRFQVSMPIGLGTTATVEVVPAARTTVRVVPGDRWKAARAAALCLAALDGAPRRVTVRLDSALAVGRGMGSSTADVVATARAVAHALGRPLSPEAAGRIAGAIEASDGTMYEGMAVVSRGGALLRAWPWWPVFNVVMLVPATVVVTETVDFAGQEKWAGLYESLVHGLSDAAARHDAAPFVAAAEASADHNQNHLANPLLGPARQWGRRFGALGANVAHTGSLVGLLFPGDAAGRRDAAGAATALRRERRLRYVDVLTATTPGPPPGPPPRPNPVPLEEAVGA